MESTEYMRGWLRGFFDGEGSVFMAVYANKKRKLSNGRTSAKKCVQRVVKVNNTDRTLIDTCSAYLNELGIEHTIVGVRPRISRHKFQWCLSIGRNSAIARFAELVGFASAEKACYHGFCICLGDQGSESQ